jgi:hypothetical protein
VAANAAEYQPWVGGFLPEWITVITGGNDGVNSRVINPITGWWFGTFFIVPYIYIWE